MEVKCGTETVGSLSLENIESLTSHSHFFKTIGIEDSLHDLFRLFLAATDRPPGAAMLHMLAEGEPAATYAHSNTQIELRTVAVSSWEWKALLASDRAVDLIFNDMLARVEHGELNPTEAELDKLDEYSDPEFTAKRQYIETVCGLTDAGLYFCGNCTVESDGIDGNKAKHCGADGVGTFALSTEGIHFYAEEKSEERCGETNVNWTTIRRWTTPPRLGDPAYSPLSEVKFGVEVAIGPGLFDWTWITTNAGTMVIRLFGRLVEHVSSQQKGAIKSYAKPASGSGAGSGACTDISVDNILFSAF